MYGVVQKQRHQWNGIGTQHSHFVVKGCRIRLLKKVRTFFKHRCKMCFERKSHNQSIGQIVKQHVLNQTDRLKHLMRHHGDFENECVSG